MSRRLGQLVAVLTLSTFLWQGRGAITLFEYDGIVECCCGPHDADHDCGCPDCPGTGKLRLRRGSEREQPADHPTVRPCRGVRYAFTVASGPAVLPSPPRLLAPDRVGVAWSLMIPAPLGCRPSPPRPPP